MKPAALFIDLQNDFLQSASLDPPAGELVHRATELLNGCRALSVPVIHVWTTIQPNDPRRMLHWKLIDKWACVQGTEGHAPPQALRPLETEPLVHKFYFSAFAEDRLDQVLRSLEIDTLLVAGLHLHVCLRATILDAYQRGFIVWVAEDAVASDDPLHAAVTRRYLEQRTTRFISVKNFLSLMDRERYGSRQGMENVPRLPPRVGAQGAVWDDVPEHQVHVSPRQNDVTLWTVPINDEARVKRATEEARQTSLEWRRSAVPDRMKILDRLIGLLEAESSELAKQMAIEIGKPITYGQAEVARGMALLKSILRYAKDDFKESSKEAGLFRRQPLGVIAMITPWNNPLAIPVGKIGPALVYGNTVVWKPAPAATSVSIRIMDLLRRSGCTPGSVHLLCGNRSTAEALMSDERVDAVTLTGSLAAGYSAQAICSRRHIPLQAELGGNNAAIVWSDCDLEQAASTLAEAAFGLAGQRCTANRRVVVEDRCYDIFTKALEAAVGSLVWGDPLDPKTQVGPLISLEAKSRVAAAVSRAQEVADKIMVPHRHSARYEELTRTGAYYPPTVIFCNHPEHEIVQEETFGPVMVIQRASDWGHAMQLCNGVRQGLVAALFSRSEELKAKFLAEAQAGVLKLNSATAGVGVEAPFGGQKASGIGPPEHGAADREFYTFAQAIYR
ncbi:MAG TPA: aldehyde dehydrogenase family protein [Nitrospiria bacterium]|nr:aldehyde dehydrogenase family protein [Nitrospiria bacterium]